MPISTRRERRVLRISSDGDDRRVFFGGGGREGGGGLKISIAGFLGARKFGKYFIGS